MSKKTITSANSTFVLTVETLFPAGVSLEGYAADAAFAFEAADTAETMLGVDGKMSAGWVPRIYPQTISLQADSSSRPIIDAIVQAQDVGKTIFWLSAVISLPSVGQSYTLTNGVLKRYKVAPDAKRVLQPAEYVIDWESVQPAVI